MPLGNASENPSHEHRRLASFGDEPATSSWTIPLGRLGSVRFFLSSSVLVAVAIVIVVVATVTGRQGNADLPMLALIGAAFWVSGWAAQIVVELWVSGMYRRPVPSVTVNLVGIESRPRRWPPIESLMVSFSSLAALLCLGAVYWWADGGFQTPVFVLDRPDIWSVPSFGFAASDSVWLVGAWLCWAQALCQTFPLPKTTGRHILGAITSLCSRRLGAAQQVAVFRRCLVVMSLVTLVIAILMIRDERGLLIPRWPWVFFLSVLLWISTRARDLEATILSFQSAQGIEVDGDSFGTHEGDCSRLPDDEDRLASVMREGGRHRGLWTRIRRSIKARGERRRVRQAMEIERREAVDAAQVDEILARLHEQGAESLSDDDRRILQRVSRSLRKSRDSNEDEQSGELP
jgi:hypothetical protein